jgi:glyoxylase-like metal-dependent hydrolase (beta-lactamase superfamily II)
MKIAENLFAFLWQDAGSNNANTFLIRGAKNILIDPGHFHLFGYVRERLSELSLAVEDVDLIVVTHAHPDHVEGIQAFSSSSTLITLHPAELRFIKEMAPQYGAGTGIADFQPSFLLQEGELRVDDMIFQVLHTPGHSPGSICFYWGEKKALFSGDVIFQQGLGRTDLPGGNGDQMKESIRRLSQLDVEILLPGHGNVVSGKENVRRNFTDVESTWFGYI